MEIYSFTDGKWKMYDEQEDEWVTVMIVKVPIETLLEEYNNLLRELSQKEEELNTITHDYREKQINIMYIENIDFKTLYGKANDDIRKHHFRTVHAELIQQKEALELSTDYIKRVIGLFKRVIDYKILYGDY